MQCPFSPDFIAINPGCICYTFKHLASHCPTTPWLTQLATANSVSTLHVQRRSQALVHTHSSTPCKSKRTLTLAILEQTEAEGQSNSSKAGYQVHSRAKPQALQSNSIRLLNPRLHQPILSPVTVFPFPSPQDTSGVPPSSLPLSTSEVAFPVSLTQGLTVPLIFAKILSIYLKCTSEYVIILKSLRKNIREIRFETKSSMENKQNQTKSPGFFFFLVKQNENCTCYAELSLERETNITWQSPHSVTSQDVPGAIQVTEMQR